MAHKEIIMSASKRTSEVLAVLIPAGVLGISSALATTQAIVEPDAAHPGPSAHSIAERLTNIRKAVSAITEPARPSEPKLMVAEWLNFGGGIGWHNGGWGNGGWHNGGWGNGGWHNAPNWGNGGWHNWGNGGWHNAPNWGNGGWHNFWHNW
jgi:rSAM-associated Gly-rich repeat protein